MGQEKGEIYFLYLAGSKTKPTIRAIMTRASTCVITCPEVSTADLRTFLVFDDRIHIGILAITSSATAWTVMATS